jgi:hypothetical protein
VLPPPPLLCNHRCRRPAAPLSAAAKLPPSPTTPSLRCLRRPCAADAAAASALSTVTAPLPRCLRRSADAATALPTPFTALLPPSPCCRRRCRPVTLLPRCSPPLSCHHRCYCRHCSDAAALALATPSPH